MKRLNVWLVTITYSCYDSIRVFGWESGWSMWQIHSLKLNPFSSLVLTGNSCYPRSNSQRKWAISPSKMIISVTVIFHWTMLQQLVSAFIVLCAKEGCWLKGNPSKEGKMTSLEMGVFSNVFLYPAPTWGWFPLKVVVFLIFLDCDYIRYGSSTTCSTTILNILIMSEYWWYPLNSPWNGWHSFFHWNFPLGFFLRHWKFSLFRNETGGHR